MNALLSITDHNPKALAFGVTSAAISATDADFLSALTINELDALYEAGKAAADAYTAVANQPRVTDPSELQEMLSQLTEEAERICSHVIAALKAKSGEDFYERRQRAHLLLLHACRSGEDIPDVAVMAASLSRHVGREKF